jgi:hypothetical protein
VGVIPNQQFCRHIFVKPLFRHGLRSTLASG